MKTFLGLCALMGCFAVFSQASFEQICRNADAEDCRAYEEMGLNMTICRFDEFFPNFSRLPLADNAILNEHSKKYCALWMSTPASNLYPNYMGEECLNEYRQFDAIRLMRNKTAFVACVHYILALNFWKLRALDVLKTADGYSKTANEAFIVEQYSIENQNAVFKDQEQKALSIKITFPQRKSSFYDWPLTKPATAVVGMSLLLMGYSYYRAS